MIQSAWGLAQKLLKAWNEDACTQHAAALSFFLVLSLSPLIIILTAAAGTVLGQDAVQAYIIEQLTLFAGPDVAESIQPFLASIQAISGSVLASIIGFVTLLYSATIFLGQVHRTLNVIWKAPPHETEIGILKFIRQRLLAVLMMVGIIVFFFFTFIAGNIATGLKNELIYVFPELATYSENLNLSVMLSLGFVFLLFTAVFRFVPDVTIAWRPIVVGAVFSTVLFGIGQQILQIYLQRVSVSSIYGAAGSLMVVLLWIYYSMQIFLLGAEFTYLIATETAPELPQSHVESPQG